MNRRASVAVSVVALVVVAAAAVGQRAPADGVRGEAAGWYGAMELYRSVALWAGKRAMSAEMNYWKAVD